jgi:hypothetical protein
MENKEKKFLNKKRERNPNGRNGHLNQNRNKSFNKSEEKNNKDNKENFNRDERKKDLFNTGDFKKKYNKEYILSKQKPKFGRKYEKKKTNSKEEETINHNNLNLTITENLFKKAKEIYDKKVI